MTEREAAYLKAACKVAWNAVERRRGYCQISLLAFFAGKSIKEFIPHSFCTDKLTPEESHEDARIDCITFDFADFRAAFMRWCDQKRGKR